MTKLESIEFTKEELSHLDYFDNKLYDFLKEKYALSKSVKPDPVEQDLYAYLPKWIKQLDDIKKEADAINKSPHKDLILLKIKFDIFYNNCDELEKELDKYFFSKSSLNKFNEKEYDDLKKMVLKLNKKLIVLKNKIVEESLK